MWRLRAAVAALSALRNDGPGHLFVAVRRGAGASRVEEMFKDFISSGEAERVGVAGAPTAAALRGVNHRLLHPYAKANPRRVSFRDTGLFQSSFKAWVD